MNARAVAKPFAAAANPLVAALVATPIVALIVALLCLFSSCAGDPAEIAEARSPDSDAAAQKQPSALSFGWFESRYGVERVKKIAEEGSGIVVPYVGSKGDAVSVSAYLDAAAGAGLGVALQIPGDFVQSGDMTAVRSWVMQFRDHPAVRLWYLFDEPDVHAVSPERLAEAARCLRAEGGGRPIAITFYRPQDAERRYAGSFDVLWLNYYPVFVGTPEFLGISAGGFAARVKAGSRAARATNTAFGMILQAYGSSESGENQFNRRLPTAAELSYMAWVSLREDPSYLLFWSRYRTSEAWLEEVFRPTMAPLMRIVAGGIEPVDEKGLKIQKAEVDLFHFRAAGGEYVTVIAGSRRSRKANLVIPDGVRLMPALIPPSVGIVEQGRGRWILEMPAFSVAVLELLR